MLWVALAWRYVWIIPLNFRFNEPFSLYFFKFRIQITQITYAGRYFKKYDEVRHHRRQCRNESGRRIVYGP